MKILLAYDTYSSGTERAATVVYETLLSYSHEVTMKRIAEIASDEILSAELTIFGSPSWLVDNLDGQPHIRFMEFMKKNENVSFAGKKFAVFGLGELTYARFCGAVDKIEQFIEDRGGVTVTPSLRIDGFYFAQDDNEMILKEWAGRIALGK